MLMKKKYIKGRFILNENILVVFESFWPLNNTERREGKGPATDNKSIQFQ